MIDTAGTDVSTESDQEGRVLGLLLTVGGAIGLVAAFVLTRDKIRLIENPDAAFGCDVNAFVSCGGVMQRSEASVFGFPNSLLGIVGFSVVMTLGVLLLGGVRLPGFVWSALQAGVVLGIVFVTWLQYQSIVDIGKLCPYCMVVWAVMIPLFVAVTARNLVAVVPDNVVARFLSEWTLLVTLLWYVAVLAAIWFTFGSDLWA